MRRKEDDDDETARGKTRSKNEGKERMTNSTVLDTGVRNLLSNNPSCMFLHCTRVRSLQYSSTYVCSPDVSTVDEAKSGVSSGTQHVGAA